jgi:hypothetical protein
VVFPSARCLAKAFAGALSLEEFFPGAFGFAEVVPGAGLTSFFTVDVFFAHAGGLPRLFARASVFAGDVLFAYAGSVPRLLASTGGLAEFLLGSHRVPRCFLAHAGRFPKFLLGTGGIAFRFLAGAHGLTRLLANPGLFLANPRLFAQPLSLDRLLAGTGGPAKFLLGTSRITGRFLAGPLGVAGNLASSLYDVVGVTVPLSLPPAAITVVAAIIVTALILTAVVLAAVILTAILVAVRTAALFVGVRPFAG